MEATFSAQDFALQAITTRYLGPTNYRGSRVKAVCDAGSVTISWDCALDPFDNHQAAAIDLARKLGWGGEWIGGGLSRTNKDAYCFVRKP